IMRLMHDLVDSLLILFPCLDSDQPALSQDGTIYGCTEPKTLALTFDDGPHIYTPSLLRTLDQYGVKATFFVNGDNYGSILTRKNREIVQQAYHDGHQIASHTWDHKDLATLTGAQVRKEMTRLDDALRQIIGRSPLYMRPPYGSTSPMARRILHDMGYKVVIWNIETQDTEHPNNVAASMDAYHRALEAPGASRKGWIALQHDPVRSTSLQLAPQAIRLAQRLGYRFATVAECLGDEGGEYRS
ncbi:chitin deacetylase, partial [Piptocephalis cylindrospora]